MGASGEDSGEDRSPASQIEIQNPPHSLHPPNNCSEEPQTDCEQELKNCIFDRNHLIDSYNSFNIIFSCQVFTSLNV